MVNLLQMFGKSSRQGTFTAACVMGQIGSGRGGFYITNARAGVAASARRDLAVVLLPLGSTKVFSWDGGAGAWTQ